MSKINTMFSTVAVAVAAFAAVTVAQSPASAEIEQCNARGLCAWYNDLYGGTYLRFTASDTDLGGHGDEFDSLYNRDTVAWYLRDDTGTGDHAYCIRPGHKVPRLSAYGLHDKISSISRRATSPACQAGTSPIGG